MSKGATTLESAFIGQILEDLLTLRPAGNR